MKHFLLAFFLLPISVLAAADKREVAEMIKRIELSVEIGKMVGADQAFRFGGNVALKRGIAWEEITSNPLYKRKIGRIDSQNAVRLKAIFKKIGWPKLSEYGEYTAHNAWLLVQHMDTDVQFQEEILSKMTELLLDNECSKADYAYLYDRVQVNKGKPQRYGSQGQCVGHGHLWEPKPIENPEELEKRRAEMGMPTMEEYRKLFFNECP